MVTTVPYRSNRVKNPLGVQAKARGGFGLAGRAAAQGAAGVQQAWAGSPMDGSVHATTAQQRAVGSIYDRIHVLRGDISTDDGEFSHKHVMHVLVRQRDPIRPHLARGGKETVIVAVEV